MKIGDKVLWKPIGHTTNLEICHPFNNFFIVTILKFDLKPPKPLVMVKWYDNTKSWVLLNDLFEIK